VSWKRFKFRSFRDGYWIPRGNDSLVKMMSLVICLRVRGCLLRGTVVYRFRICHIAVVQEQVV
jgi:hypothetical protein